MGPLASSWKSSALALALFTLTASASPVEPAVRAYFNDGVPLFTSEADDLPPQVGCERIESVGIERIDGNRVDVAVSTRRPALDVAHYSVTVDGARVVRVVSRERDLAERFVAANESGRRALLDAEPELVTVTFVRIVGRIVVDHINRGDRAGAVALADVLAGLAGDDLRKRAVVAQVQSILARTAPGAVPGAGADLAQEALELSTRAGDAGLAAGSLVYLGRAVRKIDREAAIAHFQRALAMESEISEPSTFSQAATQLADLYDRVQRYAPAMRYAMEALRHAEASGDRVALLAARMNIAGSFWQQGDLVTAARHYEAALALAQALRFPATEASVRGTMARIYASLDRPAEAAAMARRALELLGCDGDTAAEAETRFGLLTLVVDHWLSVRDLFRAEAAVSELLDAAWRAAEFERTGSAFAQLAHIRLLQGRHDDALQLARTAMLSGVEDRAVSVFVQAYRASGRSGDAEQLLRKLVTRADAHAAEVVNDPRLRWTYSRTRGEPYFELVRLLLERDADAEALQVAERWKTRVLEELIARPATSADAMTDEERALTRRLEEKVREANRAFVAGSGDEDARRLARLEQQDHMARLRARHGGEAPAVQQAPPATAGPDLVIEYAVGQQETIAFAVSWRGGARYVEAVRIAAGRARVRELAAAYRRMLQNRDLRHRRLSRELYALLVAPVLRGRDPRDLVVIPDDALWTIPFHALAVDDRQLLLDRTAVSYAPSLAVLDSAIARRNAPLSAARVLAVGGAEGAPLPDAAREVREIGRIYGPRARTLVGSTATEAAVKAEASRYGVVHVATHGSVDERFPMYSAVLLAGSDGEDGLLEARELIDLRLDAELLVLSACDTASGELVAGEGVVGLSWAALGAGVRTAVVSQWRVESAVTAELMIRFHRRLAAGMAPARALRAAQRAVAKDPRFAHPSDWAAFIVVGAP